MTEWIIILAKIIVLPALGVVAKCIHWLYELKTNHFPHLQAAMEAIPPALERQSVAFEKTMQENTSAIVGAVDRVNVELKEQRADIRALSLRV